MFDIGDKVKHKSCLFGHNEYVNGIVTNVGRVGVIQVKFNNPEKSHWWLNENELERVHDLDDDAYRREYFETFKLYRGIC